jgi:uncharacterized protein involved in exopolysaccharide biosynthesis
MLYLPQPDNAPSAFPQFELLPKILNTIFKWKWLIAASILAVVVPVAVVTLLKQPQYEVKMKVLIKSSRAQLAMNFGGDRGASQSPLVTWPVTQQVLNSEIQILRSQDLLVQAVTRSGYPLLAPDQEDTPATRERALQSLRMRIQVSPVADSHVVEVSMQDADAGHATRLINTLAALYLQKHASIHAGGDATSEFFAQQVQFHRARYDRARQNLEAFQERDKIVDLKSEIDMNLTKVASMEATVKDLQAEIEAGQRELVELERQIQELPEEVTRERTVITNPEVAAMRMKLVELERQRDELQQRYTPKSRFVLDKEGEIATLQRSIKEREQVVVDAMIVAQNRIKETVRQQLLAKRAAVDAAVARQQAVGRERQSYRARLEILKDRSFEQGRLRGEFDLARDAYVMYERRAEEARVSRAMDEEKIVNVGLVQEASQPVVPLPRGLAVAGAISGVAGVVLGVVLAFALEFFNVTIQDEKDVERFLQLPVLATVRQF